MTLIDYKTLNCLANKFEILKNKTLLTFEQGFYFLHSIPYGKGKDKKWSDLARRLRRQFPMGKVKREDFYVYT